MEINKAEYTIDEWHKELKAAMDSYVEKRKRMAEKFPYAFPVKMGWKDWTEEFDTWGTF